MRPRDEADEVIVDLSEFRLLQAVNNGAPWAVRYALNCKGRSRGWGPMVRAELSGDPGGSPIRTEAVGDMAGIVGKLGTEQLERLRDILVGSGESEPSRDN